MGKNLLFVNVSKNTKIILLHNAEAEMYGHKVYNITDFSRSNHNMLSHVEYMNPNLTDYEHRILKLIELHDIDYISTQCEVLQPLIDKIVKIGKCKGIPSMAINANSLTDKEKFYKFCQMAGLPQPDTFVPTTIEQVSKYDKPLFIKPTNGTEGSIKLHLSEDKYAFYDYCRFESGDHFLNVLEKTNHLPKFLQTQNSFGELPKGKSLYGIKGRHLFQECLTTPYYYYFNFIVINGKIRFLVNNKSKMKQESNMYLYMMKDAEVQVLTKDDNNHAKVRDFVGARVFENFMEQIHTLIEHAGVELAGFNLAFIPFGDTYHLQDITLRHGGSRTHQSINSLQKCKLKYESIWEHI